jgi:hypothetical protein
MAEYTYELKKPFDYARKGDMVTANFVTMAAPSFREIEKVAPIKQALVAAISDITEVSLGQEEAQGEAGDITGAHVVQLLYRAKGSITGVMKHAEKLFKSGVALLDGEEKITDALLQKMSMEDFEGMLGDYIANFIMPSLTDGL